ncbi:MAG: tRNA epoxyqueuosine(34) reductase QueG [Acidobacteriota bacterium]
MLAEMVRSVGNSCGFEMVGIAPVEPPDYDRYQQWVADGMAADMHYLTDHRADLRRDVRSLLPEARSVICVGKLYNAPPPDRVVNPDLANISRYAWGQDYHEVMRASMTDMVEQLRSLEDFQWRICVDTAPVLERSLARTAGLGWIGKNTCLINEPLGSWFFLGEIITSLDLAPSLPPPDRCGTCTRCIDACPTDALVPNGDQWTLDSRRCISYFTIEHRGSIPELIRADLGDHVFGCDICQDVCPWNRRAPVTADPAFAANPVTLQELAAMDQPAFRERYRGTPVVRAKHAGILRNVAVAMGNSSAESYREELEALAQHAEPLVREHAEWALSPLSVTKAD